ncbi:hypothetical protein ACIHAA_08520 [Streptomyces sp. NPDC052040]|uniref:hypothetical protein n=1 Tax=Streptomyces sp. NPDC052040 TaxID=3365682 RepID=UPI0037D8E2F5
MFGILDVVADDTLTPAQRAERGDYVGRIAGALSFAEHRQGPAADGATDIDLNPTHRSPRGMHSVIVLVVEPTAASISVGAGAALPLAQDCSGCCSRTS